MIDTSEDVEGILELCHVLVKDQKDRPTSGRAGVGGGSGGQGMDRSLSGGGGGGGYVPQYGQGNGYSGMRNNQGMLAGGGQGYDREEMAEEQGWIARMVHLFKSDDLDTQFLVRLSSLTLSLSLSLV